MTLQACSALDRPVTARAGGVEPFTRVHRPGTPVPEWPKPRIHPIRPLGGGFGGKGDVQEYALAVRIPAS